MTKKPRICHSEHSEESRALMGRIINETSITNKFVTQRNDYNIQLHFHYVEPALTVGILPRLKARSE